MTVEVGSGTARLAALETLAFFVEYHGEVSPDGPEAFNALYEKLHRMQSESRH